MRAYDKAYERIGYTGKSLGNWRDKAGAYGIQEPFGALAVKQIEGDYFNVVGLPVSRLYCLLKELEVI
jgi:septum formation protein